MNTDTRLTADEILAELCKGDGSFGLLPTVANYCDDCPGADGSCEKYTKVNKCHECGSEGTLYISWERINFLVRDCRFCGDCC